MSLIAVNGTYITSGYIEIGGSKNSFLAIAFAAIALKRKILLNNVPAISDLYTTLDIYGKLNVKFKYNSKNKSLFIDSTDELTLNQVPVELIKKIRGSIYLTGALLSRNRQANLLEPGGCKIGLRPINFHLDVFNQLGCQNERIDDEIIKLTTVAIGGVVDIPKKSVGATVNAIISSIYCDHQVVITNYAPEPEIDDLLALLKATGIKLDKNQYAITIDPSKHSDQSNLIHEQQITHTIIPDRIEAISYIVLGVIVNQPFSIINLDLNHVDTVINYIEKMGAKFRKENNLIEIIPIKHQLNSLSFETGIYPGFPTDAQAQLTLLNLHAQGEFTIKENIFENRYLHVPELRKLGYDIEVIDNKIHGRGHSIPTFVNRTIQVLATDLRASITMVIAAAIRPGITKIDHAYHIYRGYPNLIEKFKNIGVDIDVLN